MPRYTPNPEREQRAPSFPGVTEDTVPCPDCNLNDFLTAISLLPGIRPMRDDYGRPLTSGCETCGGTGEVPRKKIGLPADSYDRLEAGEVKKPWW